MNRVLVDLPLSFRRKNCLSIAGLSSPVKQGSPLFYPVSIKTRSYPGPNQAWTGPEQCDLPEE